MSSLAERLKALRKENDLSQKAVAQKLKITVSALSQYETGKRTPKNDMLAALARLYHTTSDYLLGITSDPDIPYPPYSFTKKEAMSTSSPYVNDMEDSEKRQNLDRAKSKLFRSIDALPPDMQSKIISSLDHFVKVVSDDPK